MTAVWMQAIAMAASPWYFARRLRRLRRVSWSPFAWGWASFTLSQLVHIPLLILLLPLLRTLPVAVVIPFVCVLAGLCEEPARYLVMKARVPNPTLADALMLGIGHAACEAFFLALLLLYSNTAFFVIPLATVGYRAVAVAERWMATVLHAATSVLVRGSLRERRLELLGRAILLHGWFNLSVIWTAVYHGPMLGELVGLLVSLGVLAWINSCWQSEKED